MEPVTVNLRVLETQFRADGVVEYRCEDENGHRVIVRGK